MLIIACLLIPDVLPILCVCQCNQYYIPHYSFFVLQNIPEWMNVMNDIELTSVNEK